MTIDGKNLGIDFAGLYLKNPFILASASPTRNAEMIARAFEVGWAGAVIKTIYASRLDREPKPLLANIKFGRQNIGMANLSVAPPLGLRDWQREIPPLKARYPEHIVVGSISSSVFRQAEWQRLAAGIAESGIDALELDLSCTHNPDIRFQGHLPGEDIKLTRDILSWVRPTVDIPLIAKLPGLANLSSLVKACKDYGADAVSGINTIPCIAGVDLDSYCPYPKLNGQSAYAGLSGPAIKPIALRSVAEMASVESLPVSGIGGISTWRDAAEFMLLGARTVQVCTAVMWSGFGIIEALASGLSDYLVSRNIESISELVGLARVKIDNIYNIPFDRSLVAQIDQDICTNCGRCVIACRDGAFQAVVESAGQVVVDESKCDACGLCQQVCPSGAIRMVEHKND